MNPDDIEHAIAAIDAGLNNGAAIDRIVARGGGQSNRDVEVKLSAEDSVPVLEALRNVLDSKRTKKAAPQPAPKK